MRKKTGQPVFGEELARVRAAILAARDALEECRHPLLIEAAAYEIKYLEARQSYLLELARQNMPQNAANKGEDTPSKSF